MSLFKSFSSYRWKNVLFCGWWLRKFLPYTQESQRYEGGFDKFWSFNSRWIISVTVYINLLFERFPTFSSQNYTNSRKFKLGARAFFKKPRRPPFGLNLRFFFWNRHLFLRFFQGRCSTSSLNPCLCSTSPLFFAY